MVRVTHVIDDEGGGGEAEGRDGGTEGRRCEFDRGGGSREKMARRGSDGEVESVG